MVRWLGRSINNGICTFSRWRTKPEVVISHHLQQIAGCREILHYCFRTWQSRWITSKNVSGRRIHCESQDVGRNPKYTYICIRFRPPFPNVGHYWNRLGTLPASLPWSNAVGSPLEFWWCMSQFRRYQYVRLVGCHLGFLAHVDVPWHRQ